MNNISELTVTQVAAKGTSGKPEIKIKKGVQILFCAGGALSIGVAILGIYWRNARTLEVQQLTGQSRPHHRAGSPSDRSQRGDIISVTRSDNAIHRRTDICPDQWV